LKDSTLRWSAYHRDDSASWNVSRPPRPTKVVILAVDQEQTSNTSREQRGVRLVGLRGETIKFADCRPIKRPGNVPSDEEVHQSLSRSIGKGDGISSSRAIRLITIGLDWIGSRLEMNKERCLMVEQRSCSWCAFVPDTQFK
jgi:hypothetical protein